MDSQTNLREEQGVNCDVVGSSPAEIHEEVPNTPIPSQSPVLISSRSTKRGKNFSVEEDNILVSAWLNTSLDAIIGNEQKHKAFWDRIHAYFYKYKKPNMSGRSSVSLRNRWSMIQQCTNKFCEFFTQIEAMHPSGTNIQDQIEMTNEMYRERMKSTFHFGHCWNVLRHQPKWQAYISHKGVKSRRMTLPSDSSSTPDLVHLDEDNDSPSLSVYLERPLEKNAEKEIERKQKCKEISCSKTLEILTLMQEETKESPGEKIKWQDELIRLKKEKLELEKVMYEEKIIMMDTSDLSEEQEQYIRCRRAEIMAKYVPK